ncbi:hypothetical protein F7734_49680 [Scytonema sp. UIC 10036]|uniref:hypothetical protein n=1 Tax=Scytonema sp. UIC 10036 TaxID=2304196 RepID=UPI0012DA76C9|nr:hypothetical protein [Scytonema sp. UIC 10036]MUG99924.1 hypothetical protein [Scytonema sp. UIC 10036]
MKQDTETPRHGDTVRNAYSQLLVHYINSDRYNDVQTHLFSRSLVLVVLPGNADGEALPRGQVTGGGASGKAFPGSQEAEPLVRHSQAEPGNEVVQSFYSPQNQKFFPNPQSHSLPPTPYPLNGNILCQQLL